MVDQIVARIIPAGLDTARMDQAGFQLPSISHSLKRYPIWFYELISWLIQLIWVGKKTTEGLFQLPSYNTFP
jgi:hypothetical protein